MMQRVTGKYIYRAADGTVSYWKERIEPGRKSRKEFRFYHGKRETGRGGDPILYNLPAVIASKAVIFTEGEKQADILTAWGLCGTTFDSGSNSKFPPAMVDHLKGKRIAILRDNDAPGLVYAEMIATTLHGICEVAKIVLLPELPDKGDICDWAGGDNGKIKLLSIIRETPEFVYMPEQAKTKSVRRQAERSSGEITADMIAAAASVPVDSLLEFTKGYAYCLWHTEDNPSLHHYVKANRVKCFSCGFGGSAVDVLMKRDGLTFVEAVRSLAR